jgi:superfamily II DNA/RNA helicase
MNFTDLGLSRAVLDAVADAGYSQPTPIQEMVIPPILSGRDVLGTAPTGTGKTAGFTLPLLDRLVGGRVRARMPRALVLEPTRELADQVITSFAVYGKYHKITSALLIGGVSFSDQERNLERGVDVLVATPGRLLDHIGRGKVLLGGVQILVIDEADRMMDMGFMPDVERIVRLLPPLRQTLFFSATMPPDMRKLAQGFLRNPVEVAAAPLEKTAITVTQTLGWTNERGKRDVLRQLLRVEDVKNALIFCNRKRTAEELYKSLERHGFNALALHGDMNQTARMETLAKFKAGTVRLLVASDVAARGLDVEGMSHVFNFDVPMHPEDYIHRIGRTGRAGMAGKAITLATPADREAVAAIEKLIGKPIEQVQFAGVDLASPDVAADDTESRGPRRGKRSPGRNQGPRQGRNQGRNQGRHKSAPHVSERRAPVAAEGERDAKTPEIKLADAAAGQRPTQPPASAPRPAPRPHATRPQAPRPDNPAPAQAPAQVREPPSREPDFAFGGNLPAFMARPTARRT